MTILLASCATLAALVSSAPSGSAINLAKGSVCERIVLKRAANLGRVTVNAGATTTRGLTISGANIRWRSGVLAAWGGKDGQAGAGYAALVRGASNVRFDAVTITDARKGIVVDGTTGLTVADSRFLGLREDGIIASKMSRLIVVRNRFAGMTPLPSTCVTTTVTFQKVPKRDCDARGGTWRDGNHADAVQMWNGVTDVLISGNTVTGPTQGMTQMGSGLPLQHVVIEKNDIAAEAHHITLGIDCIDCVIRGNKVRRFPGADQWKAVIRPGSARRCGNDTVDEPRDAGC